jgi:hypothetical protein
MASVAADQHEPGRAGAFAVFASPRLEYDWHDIDQHKKLIADALAGMGWQFPGCSTPCRRHRSCTSTRSAG